MQKLALDSSKHIFQLVIAIVLMTLLLLGSAAPYAQDEPVSFPARPAAVVGQN